MATDRRICVAVTTGEPAGVGPLVSLKAAAKTTGSVRCILLGDFALLEATAKQYAVPVTLRKLSLTADGTLPAMIPAEIPGTADVIDIPLAAPAEPGILNPENAAYVLKTLDVACDGALSGLFDAISTAPVQKSVINDAGFPFTGHTEYFADRTATGRVVMVLQGETSAKGICKNDLLRVALATTHLPLKDVSSVLTKESLAETLAIVHRDLKNRFGLSRPKILVAGLNPHAGENGWLGREEIDVIDPVIGNERKMGRDVSGPFPADTLFLPHRLKNADCILAMYHDQGLPVLKFAAFEKAVNVTLGMNIIRTSADHGTALDIAAADASLASPDSMVEAVLTAALMAKNEQNA